MHVLTRVQPTYTILASMCGGRVVSIARQMDNDIAASGNAVSVCVGVYHKN